MKTDILIVGSGCSGLYCALRLPKDKQILILSKSDPESSDSFLAQGGMCMLRDEADYDSYFEDTMRAGHFENDPVSVELMIRTSPRIVDDLLQYGVDFAREADGSLAFTQEGAHSNRRILFHKDITGKEITSHLLETAQQRSNITLLPYTTLIDLISRDNRCYGGVVRTKDGTLETIEAKVTVLATGGIGGLYRHSTNFRHLTGDGLAVALKHGIALKDTHYVQIHPTTFYSEREEDRSFLISESVRGEGAKLYDKNMERFVDELLPRDLVTNAIRAQMSKDGTNHVWEDLRPIPQEELQDHFPNIVAHCTERGYDITRQCIPIVPAQHYYMGGIQVDHQSKTSMEQLYAVGETACNGVHGRNRLASNSLLESLVFAGRAADDLMANWASCQTDTAAIEAVDLNAYPPQEILEQQNRKAVQRAICRSAEHAASWSEHENAVAGFRLE